MEVPPEIESSLGKYRLIASLARGGMARVYLTLVAGPADVNKLVVLKVLGDGLTPPPAQAVKMFLSEARLATRLVHPNIVHSYEVGESAGRFFIAMEYVEGQTYRAFRRRAGLDGVLLSEHLLILSELARGLHGLHTQTDYDGRPLDAVHRDVSPQNVLLGYDGQVKLLDFGIAETVDTSSGPVDAIRGKLDYIAPEQLRGDNVDHRADVFALGVMLYEALTERRFAGGMNVGDYEKVQSRLAGTEARLLTLAPHAPPELVGIAERAIALDPDRRWPSALSFAEALDAFAERQPDPPRREALAWRLSKLFEKDRATLRKRVEREIERVRQGHFVELGTEGTGELPRFGTSELTSIAPGAHEVTTTSEPVHRSTRAVDTLPVPASAPRASTSSRAPRNLVPARSWAVIFAAIAVAAAFAWLTPPSRDASAHETPSAAVLRSRAEPSASFGSRAEPSASTAVGAVQRPEPLPQATPATSPVPNGLPKTIRAQVAVTPENADVRLDGVELSTPVSAEFVRDGKPHLLEASARGYAPYQAHVVFDRDRVFKIILETARHGGHRDPSVHKQARDDATSETSTLLSRAEEPPTSTQSPSASPAPSAPKMPSRTTLYGPSEDGGPTNPASKVSTLQRMRELSIDTSDPYLTRP